MTRCLITGLTGFVASHLTDYLLEHTDWSIHGLIRWRSPLDNIEHLLPRINQGDRIRLLYGDLRDTLSIRDAVRTASPDFVFHLAAQSYPQTSFTAPLDTLETNVQGTARVLDAVKEYAPGAVVHVCSSSEVYGRAKKTPIAEDAPFHPASPYGISKVGADLLARHYAEAYGLRVMITRMGTHTGPRRGDVFMESTFAKQIALAEAGKIEPVIKHGNLKSLRTIADVRDAVRAYHMLVTMNPQSGEIYNIAGDYVCTVGDVLAELRRGSRVPLTLQQDPERIRPIDADNQVFDTAKFRAHTGWVPVISLKETMGCLLDYWRAKVARGNFLTR